MPDDQDVIAYAFFCESLRSESGGKVTAIGKIGELLRIFSAPPAATPLAFHVYLRNLKQEPWPVSIGITIEGGAVVPEMKFPLNTVPGAVGNNININFRTLIFPQAGFMTAKVRVECNPPAEQEFRLEIRFEPAGISDPAS